MLCFSLVLVEDTINGKKRFFYKGKSCFAINNQSGIDRFVDQMLQMGQLSGGYQVVYLDFAKMDKVSVLYIA